MAISSLDTLDIAKRLKQAGFNDAQAEAVTTVFRDVRTADFANLATRGDIERLEAATKADIERLEAGTKADIEAVRVDIRRLEAATRSDIQRLEAATKADIRRVEDKIEIAQRDITIRLGSMIIIATGVLLAAKFFG